MRARAPILRFRKATSEGHARLVAVSVASHVIDGAVDRPWVIDVHEAAGAVVDGLARYRHVIGVHDAMNEADEQPLRYKRCLARDHQVEEGVVPVRGVNRLWVMPRDDASANLSGERQ